MALTSSDAKSRCMWLMFVWSILMTLVSQFLELDDHVAFFFFAGISVLVMPAITAIYSNTSGRHGSGLLRAGYVFCDPVLVCITITPLQLLNKLPKLLDEYFCLNHHLQWNATVECLQNKSADSDLLEIDQLSNAQWSAIMDQKREQFLIIQGCMVVPILLSLLMGRRSRKMNINTYIFVFAYWLICAIEAADLLETAMLSNVYEHVIFTTEAIMCIVMIITNSYAIVTLCSYLTPAGPSGNKEYEKKFDFLYRAFVGVAGILFAEVPLLIARFQIMLADGAKIKQGSFYMWIAKDILFAGLIVIVLATHKIGSKYQKFLTKSCAPTFDNPHVFFQPEKRDVYINSLRQKKCQSAELGYFSSSLTSINCSPSPSPNRSPNRSPNLSKKKGALSQPPSLETIPELHPNASELKRKTGMEKTLSTSPMLIPPEKKRKTNTSPDSKKKVTFKIDKGKGRFSVFQAREEV